MFSVVPRVPFGQTLRETAILGMCSVRPAGASVRIGAPYREPEDSTPGSPTGCPCTAVNENHYRAPHIFRCIEEALVDPQLSASIAHDNGAVAGKPDCMAAMETKPVQLHLQLPGRVRPGGWKKIE